MAKASKLYPGETQAEADKRQAEDDADTLYRAGMIKKDKSRLKAALKCMEEKSKMIREAAGG